MNEFIEKIITRHAIRRFEDRQIEEETLQQILTAGLYAPSAGNNQNSRIVVSQDKEVNETLGKMNRLFHFGGKEPTELHGHVSDDQPSILDDINIKSAFYGAPTVITIFVRSGGYSHNDTAFMAANMWLAAHFLGVGACYIGRAEATFKTEYGLELREKWGIPEGMTAVGHLILGYREGPEPNAKPRKEGRVIRV